MAKLIWKKISNLIKKLNNLIRFNLFKLTSTTSLQHKSEHVQHKPNHAELREYCLGKLVEELVGKYLDLDNLESDYLIRKSDDLIRRYYDIIHDSIKIYYDLIHDVVLKILLNYVHRHSPYESIYYTCSYDKLTIKYKYFGKISTYEATISVTVLDDSVIVECTGCEEYIKEVVKINKNYNNYNITWTRLSESELKLIYILGEIERRIFKIIEKIRDKILNMEEESAKKIVLETIKKLDKELEFMVDDIFIDLNLDQPQLKPEAEGIFYLKQKPEAVVIFYLKQGDPNNAIRIYGKICGDLFIINEIEVKCEDEMYNDLVFSGLIEKIVEYINSLKSSK